MKYHAVISRDDGDFRAHVEGLPINVAAPVLRELDRLLQEEITHLVPDEQNPDMEWTYTTGGVVLLARREGMLAALLAGILAHEPTRK